MQIEPFFLNITSEQPEVLLTFYRDVVGIPQTPDYGPHSLDAAGVVIGIDGHSETRGRAQEPQRYLLNFVVNGFDVYEKRLDDAGTSCVRRRGKEPWGGTISTYEDPDGNYFQLFDWQAEPDAQPGITDVVLNLTSVHPERLLAFYRDTVGLVPRGKMGGPWDLAAGTGVLTADGHDGIYGKAKEPHRWLIDFWVEDIDAEEQRLIAAGVPCIRSKGTEFWGGVISTFVDPDGNYFQLVQYRPELATEGGF
jgi:predicted enzyme related to lactoylglutathione lyase